MTDTGFLPLIPLKDIVLFPGVTVPLFVGRAKSLLAINTVNDSRDNGKVLFVSQKKVDIEDPIESDMYKFGVLGKILQRIELSNGSNKLIVEAQERVYLTKIDTRGDFLSAEYSVVPDEAFEDFGLLNDQIIRLLNCFQDYANVNKKINEDVLNILLPDNKNPSYITNILASYLTCGIAKRQSLLEITNICKRAESLSQIITEEIAVLETEQMIQSRVKKQIEKTQRDYYLNEQKKAIQQELGEIDEKSDLLDLENKIKNIKLSKEAKEKAESELRKLKMMNPATGESGAIRNYLETLLSLPWGKVSRSKINTSKATDALNRDHHGLEKVKERIVEYIAVLERSKTFKGPILCFVGPPGVGKTSLVKSIAEAVGRKYVKFALGGVRDEAEVRGHRRTYIGSMPGKIIQLIKKAKVDNPVMLLDEIDKMGFDHRGDPASALLEVLDKEQNKNFVDHYIEAEYDISNVIFIATANSLNIPRALADRLEIIMVSGYAEEEKLQIAKNYLIPKQFKAHGIKKTELNITDDALTELIRYYTRESGVRNIEREIANLTRKSLKRILSDSKVSSIKITAKNVDLFLGPRKYRIHFAEKEDVVGNTTGMAYTDVGGELLSIEAVSIPGKGEIKATGKLGEVMKESAQAAYSYFRSRASTFGISYTQYRDKDIHLHVPEGATPKDGPSAGIAIYTTIISLMTNTPVKKTVAMTGEITLRGNVLPIGGLREKLLAANRGGIKTVIIPEKNKSDIIDIPESVKKNLKIVTVSQADEALKIALTRKPVAPKVDN